MIFSQTVISSILLMSCCQAMQFKLAQTEEEFRLALKTEQNREEKLKTYGVLPKLWYIDNMLKRHGTPVQNGATVSFGTSITDLIRPVGHDSEDVRSKLKEGDKVWVWFNTSQRWEESEVLAAYVLKSLEDYKKAHQSYKKHSLNGKNGLNGHLFPDQAFLAEGKIGKTLETYIERNNKEHYNIKTLIVKSIREFSATGECGLKHVSANVYFKDLSQQ